VGWKVSEAQALELYRRGMTDGQIAERFGCTHECVALVRRKHSLLPNVASMSLRGQRGLIAQARQRGKHELAAMFEQQVREAGGRNG